MPIDPATIDAMVAAGFSAEQMAVVLKSELIAERAAAAAADEARKARAREGNRERQARFRSRRNANNAGNGVTTRDIVTPQNVPPHPPINPPGYSDPSVPSGSAADAATAPAEPMDPRRELFGRGKQTVRKLTGRAMDGCGSLIGKWLKVANDDAVIVLAVIDDAVAKELANPIPWIEATIKSEAQRNGSGSHDLFNGRASGGRPSGTVNTSVSTAVARHAARLGIGPGSEQDDRRPRDAADHRPRRDDPKVEDAEWSPARGYYAAH